MSEQLWWYVARASGMVAAVLLILTLIWGLLITTKLIERRGLPAWLTDLHRYLGGLSVVFIAVHLVALVFDNYLVFSWSDLFVPFASSWKAGPVAWGIGAFWGLVIVEGTSLLQRRMKRSIWRGLHFLSYPVALMTAIHAIQAGTDAGNVVFRAVSIGLIGVLSALTIFRILYTPQKRSVVPGGSGGSGAARAAALRAAAARNADQAVADS
jgi:DMSO/TMAO reductase YedYZ heme-binding membrane subunit